jgi:hypothetical protein
MTPVLLSMSAILALVSPVTYIVSIVRGNAKPHRLTRFILLFVLGLNFVSIVAAHGNLGAKLFAGITFAQALVIFLMSLWRGMGGHNSFDWICFVIAFVGIAGWKLTGSAVTGVWFSVFADLSAYLPAFIKTWKQPDTETPWYYMTAALAALFSLVAYKIGNVAIFQIYIIICSLIMLLCIYHKKIYPMKTIR